MCDEQKPFYHLNRYRKSTWPNSGAVYIKVLNKLLFVYLHRKIYN